MPTLPSSSDDDEAWGSGITIFISEEAKLLWRKGELASHPLLRMRLMMPVFETFLQRRFSEHDAKTFALDALLLAPLE